MRVALVPGVLALSDRYASLSDPVADLRSAVEAALEWVGPDPRVIGDTHGVIGELIARREPHLDGREPRFGGHEPRFGGREPRFGGREPHLDGGGAGGAGGAGVVIVANGSAKRTEKAPGHFDERALVFDDWLREALTVEPGELTRLDTTLADELWADVAALPALAEILTGPKPADFAPAETDRGPQRPKVRLIGVDYDDDPYGVKYWVIRWEVG